MPLLRDRSPLLRTCLAAALLAAPALWLFGVPLLLDRAPLFRDSADYYPPLWSLVGEEWEAGRVPWFNAWENGGQPLAGDTTAAAFYPGRLCFLPPLSFARGFQLFLLLHVLLALAGGAAAARALGASPRAAWFAGPCYAYSGYVLSQHANVVYLVGAAWLPWALAAGWLLIRRRQWRYAALLAPPLALMILGGDPQTALHALLLLGLAALLPPFPRPARRGRRSLRPAPGAAAKWGAGFRRGARRFAALGLLLAAASLGAALLAAAQLAPAAAVARQTERAHYTQPRSLWEPEHRAGENGFAAPWWREPPAGEHASALYDFSLPPWQAAEFGLPNVAGRMYPENHRWTASLPLADRVWAPSLYLGVLPLWLAGCAFHLRRAPLAARWPAWGALLSLAAALGWYGLGWIASEALATAGWEAWADSIDPAAGGVYWWLVKLLPGYALFRYPAKWLVVTSLCAALLAARGLDSAPRRARRGMPRPLLGFAVASLAAGGVIGLLPPEFTFQWLTPQIDHTFGPLSLSGAAFDVALSLLHAGLAALLAAWLLARRRETQANYLALLALVVADLTLANAWLAPTAPGASWRAPSAAAAAIRGHARAAGPEEPALGRGHPLRAFRAAEEGWQPSRWREEASGDRLVELLQWNRDTLFPKHAMAEEIELLETLGSAGRYDWHLAFAAARELGPRRADGRRAPERGLLNLLGAEYLLLPPGLEYSETPPLPSPAAPGSATAGAWRLYHNPQALPRAWMVSEVRVLPALESRDPLAIVERTREILFPAEPIDRRRTAVVEGEEIRGFTEPRGAATCAVREDGARRVVVEVECERAGWLVVSRAYDPAWRAEALLDDGTTRPLAPRRTNRLLLGVPVAVETRQITFRFEPPGGYTALVVSAVAWPAWMLLLGALFLRAPRRRGPP